jgi:hypothetical protein
MHSSSDKNQNYKALATKVCDKEHLVYLHYCRFWDVNVRDKLIIVSHKYFKWFHVAEEKKIMAAATNRHTLTARQSTLKTKDICENDF